MPELRTLPHDLDAERAVLGAILLDTARMAEVSEMLTPEDFYLEAHRLVFKSMLGLFIDSRKIDMLTVKSDLQSSDCLEKCGGPAVITSLTDGMPRSANVEAYARIVRERSSLRRLIHLGTTLQGSCQAADSPIAAILERTQRELLEIHARESPGGLVPISQVAYEGFRDLEMLSAGKRNVGLETGFAELDRMTGGLQPSDLIVVAASPAQGKTSLCLNIAAHVALRKASSVGIFSLEMSKNQIFRRLVASEAEVDMYRLTTGKLSKDDWGRVSRATEMISASSIELDDSCDSTIHQLRARAERLAQHKKLDLLIVDYLQLITGSRKRNESRTQEITEITRQLKSMARSLHIPVVVASQLNRQGEASERPRLWQLRESGSIEQDADVVIFIWHRKDDKLSHLHVAKQRNGPEAELSLVFIRQFTKFANPYVEVGGPPNEAFT